MPHTTATLPDVDLPVMPPVQPMLAKSVKGVPQDPGFSFVAKAAGSHTLAVSDASYGGSANSVYPCSTAGAEACA